MYWKNMSMVIIISMVSILLSLCKVHQGVSSTPSDQNHPVITLVKSPCFGTCPVFEMSVYNDLTVIYQGKKYTNKIGFYDKKIDQDQYDAILEIFDETDFWSLDDVYNSNVMDAPATEISIRRDTIVKTVKCKLNGPKSFEQVDQVLTDLANSGGWNALSPPEETDVELNQIIFQLRPDVKMESWITQYKPYAFQIVSRLSPKLNYWVASYDLETISKKDILSLLRKDKDIVNAEFNQKVNVR